MAGTKCDANRCNGAVDQVLTIRRPDWMVEQVDSVESKEYRAYLCGSHAETWCDGCSGEKVDI